MRPPVPNITLSRRSRIALWTAGTLLVLIIVLVQTTGVYINYLWFGSLGYRGVYTTIFWTRLVLFLIFGITMALIIGVNLVVAYLLRPPFRPMSVEQQNIERYRVLLEPRRWLVLIGVTLIALFSAGLAAQGNWATWQLWLHGGSFGQKDPQFHLDISFFAWDYPAYRLLLGFGFSAILFSLILSAGVHYLLGAIRLQTPGPKITLSARRHLTVLVFVFIVLKAMAYWLDRYGLVFSGRSKFTGASYTDVHAVLPSRTILFWIAIIIALGLIASLWLRSTLLPGIAFVSMLVLSILISGIYPAILQQVSVKPNASSKEAPYIKKNIEATRDAYNIATGGNVAYVDYKATPSPDLSAPTQTGNPTLDNIRILDPNIVSPTFARFQQFKNVYGFASKLDVDRYKANGNEQDYIVGVRELDAANLTLTQTNWINEHTNYTHGDGFVAAAANTDVTNPGDKTNTFTESGIPAKGPLGLTNGATYYGELLPDYSIVGAAGTKQEFDGNGETKVRYAGGGGVSLGNLFSRLAFAVNYKQTNFLLNNAASAKGANIIFDRDPRVMVQKVAPFLKVDGDPYPIVDSATGHIVWMVDGYTTMDNYPYSERQSLSRLTDDALAAANRTAKQPNDTINYIRNSVKATVDAYTGKVSLYRWDTKDPVLKAWASVFPNLVQDKSSMPGSIREHVRYPEDLFKVQRALLATYHVDNPVTFFNVGAKWTVPKDPTNSSLGAQPPYYVLAAPPSGSSTDAEFQLTSPMNVNNSTYLASYLSVNSDPGPDYGKITVLQLPGGSQSVQGPEQVYTLITNNSFIRKDSLSAQGAGSSNLLHGNLLTLPLGKSFLYIEPLYLQSTTSTGGAYPSLNRVIVVYGDKVGYGATLADALSDFEPGNTTGHTINLTTGGTNGTTPPPTTPPPSPASPSGSATPGGPVTVPQLDSALADLQAAYKTGDFAKIGVAQQALKDLVDRYQAQQGSASPSSSSSPPTTTTSPSPTRSGGG